MDDGSKPLEGFCLALTDYAVAPRYPGWEDLVWEVDIAEEQVKRMVTHGHPYRTGCTLTGSDGILLP
jgi:hypothetical protein